MQTYFYSTALSFSFQRSLNPKTFPAYFTSSKLEFSSETASSSALSFFPTFPTFCYFNQIMGVPAFKSWLVTTYPDITRNVTEYDCDNLYLDMTEIVYHVLHPVARASPVITNEVFMGIHDYIDGIFDTVKPRKLVYMAFDGVAPRAKMNMQRSRRFRAAKDASDAAVEEDKLRLEFQSQGKRLPAKNFMGVYFSHLVAPGTSFMADLSNYLKNYIHHKLNNDPRWKGIKVILSDANVPGEGEHKIMSFVRHQKNLPGYNENTSHCVYGSDADIVMLALATHEVNFSVLSRLVSTAKGEGNTGDYKGRMYQFLDLFVLRECIKMEVTIPDSNLEKNDLERRIDDFICMCLFLGNDFLPAIPSLHISEGAIDALLTVYKREIVGYGEYLTVGGRPDLKSLQRFIGLIGGYEDKIFQKRAVEFKAQILKFNCTDLPVCRQSPQHKEEGFRRAPTYNPVQSPWGQKAVIKNQMYENKNEMKRKLKELLGRKRDTFTHGYNKLEEDKVKLGEPGWKERYYREKFSARVEEIDGVRKEVVMKYIEGLCWVMEYYYEGVGSWKWYYPYHYAPFASDLKDFGDCNISFELGFPFKPFTQMLAISPAGNYSQPLPKEYRKLIVNPDSAIKDLYQTDFEIDTDGKRYTSEGIVKLPFVNEERLLTEVAKIEAR